MTMDLLALLLQEIVPIEDLESHVAFAQLYRQSRQYYLTTPNFVTRLCTRHGVAQPVYGRTNNMTSPLSILIGVFKHIRGNDGHPGCTLQGCAECPFLRCPPQRLEVLTQAFISTHDVVSSLGFASYGLARSVQFACPRGSNVPYRYQESSEECVWLYQHPAAACRFLTIPPVEEIVITLFDTWACRVANPAGVTVWDAQFVLNQAVWNWKLEEEGFRMMYEYRENAGQLYTGWEDYIQTRGCEADTLTVGDFISDWFNDSYWAEFLMEGWHDICRSDDGQSIEASLTFSHFQEAMEEEEGAELPSWSATEIQEHIPKRYRL